MNRRVQARSKDHVSFDVQTQRSPVRTQALVTRSLWTMNQEGTRYDSLIVQAGTLQRLLEVQVQP